MRHSVQHSDFHPRSLSIFLHYRSTFVCSMSVPIYLNMDIHSKHLHACSYICSTGSPHEAGWLNTLLYMRVWVRFYLLFKCVGPQLISFWSLHCVSKLRRDIILCLLMTEEHKTQSVQSFAWIKTEHQLESQPPSLPRRSLILLMRLRVCSPMTDKIIGLSRNRQDLWDRHDIRSVLASSWVCWEWTSWGSSKGIHTDGAEHMSWLLPALFSCVDQKKSALPQNRHAQKSLVPVIWSHCMVVSSKSNCTISICEWC